MKNLFGLLAAVLSVLVLAMPVRAELPEFSGSYLSIPWEDFKTLIEKLAEKEAEQEEEEPVPAPFVINSASYEGELLENGSARFDLEMELVVLEPEAWVMVPVIAEGPAVEEIKLDGKPVLSLMKDGRHQVLLQGAGTYRLTARFFVEAKNRGGPQSLDFRIPQTPVTTLSFTINKPGLDITSRNAAMSRINNYEKSTKLEAVLEPSERIALSWTRKVEAQKAELRQNARVQSLVTLGGHLCRVHSRISYEILHRSVTGFELSLPAAAEVVDVSGKGIADWKTGKEGENKILRISLGYEATGNYELSVNYELELPSASAGFDLPELETRGTTRETGHIGVMAGTNIEVRVKEAAGLASIDVSELPSFIRGKGSPVIHAFKYLEHPWRLALETIRHRDIEVLTCTVDKAALTSFVSREGEFVTRAVYTIRNNREQFIKVKLPEDARLFSSFRDGTPVRPSRDKDGNVLIPLAKSTGDSGKARSFKVEIVYMVKLPELDEDKGSLQLEAPSTDLLTNLLQWKLYVPEDYSYEVEESSLQEKERETPYIMGHESLLKEYEEAASKSGKRKDEGGLLLGKSAQVPNIYQYEKQKAYTPVSLPVRFMLPESGLVLEFYKAVVQEGEKNSVTLRYDKPSELWSKLWKALVAGGAILVLVVLFWIIVQAEARGRKRDREVLK
ncbi:MAG: hypothetical protein R6V10_01330 [bacterium]